MTDTSERLALAIELARQAGARLPVGAGNTAIERKTDLELITEFDRASERMILEGIGRAYPQDAILAEESGGHPGGEWIWYVDPLDGTTNFAHGLPIFSVSIAAARGGALEFGVVYDPSRDELFQAARGAGASLNERPLRVSSTRDLSDALLVTGFPYDLRTNPDNNLDRFALLSREALAVRRLGSAALDLAYVAAGRFDGYWEFRLHAWDMAAGLLLVSEAGGVVTRLDGTPDPLMEPMMVAASNGHIHAAMLAALEKAHPS
jgi:myo-inositol-1(or 4)-monophosphatase